MISAGYASLIGAAALTALLAAPASAAVASAPTDSVTVEEVIVTTVAAADTLTVIEGADTLTANEATDSVATGADSAHELYYSILMRLDEGIEQPKIVYSDRLRPEEYLDIAPVQVKVPDYQGLPLYLRPYSLTTNQPNWGRYWANVGLLAGAMVGTLVVLECLPEDATSWNRAEIQSVPPFKRWYRNIFVRNPEIDHDGWVFNYLLHPYAGAVYFMAGRSAGLNFWRSMLTSAFISTVFWEFGIEAFTERPSYQDLIITPIVGSIIGELFYRLKRDIVANDYCLFGSPVIGNIVAFLIDPVNELLDYFRGNPYRGYHLNPDERKYPDITTSLTPSFTGGAPGFSLTINF